MRRDSAGHLSAGRLDLDHAGAEVAENLRRIGPGQKLGEIEHEKPRQRAGGMRNRHDFALCGRAEPAPSIQGRKIRCNLTRAVMSDKTRFLHRSKIAAWHDEQ